MKKYLLFLCLGAFAVPLSAKAQFESLRDSVVQMFGVVMTADSLKAIPYVTVQVRGQRRGTMTNEQGVFSIVVLKGDQIEFSSIGYKPKLVEIPRNLEGNQFSMIQLLITDTVYLPATIIRPRPTREQFERDFVNMDIPADDIEIARKNNDASTRRALARTTPTSGSENSNMLLRQNAQRYYYSGQAPPQNIFNPFAWSE